MQGHPPSGTAQKFSATLSLATGKAGCSHTYLRTSQKSGIGNISKGNQANRVDTW